MGLKPEELFLSFLYWELDDVLEQGAMVRGLACTVLRLNHPGEEKQVMAWHSEKYGFPVQAKWDRQGAAQVQRRFQVTELKQHGDMWFLKTLKLDGEFRKTKLVLEQGEIHRNSVRKTPEDLFDRLEPDQPGTQRPPRHRR